MRIWTTIVFSLSLASSTVGQGTIQFVNRHAPTRLYTIDGSLAGADILGQLLFGPTVDDLAPIGNAVTHVSDGIVRGGFITVPGHFGGEVIFVQMVAWDGRLWGTMLEDVPFDQLGRTDIVPYTLGSPTPAIAPLFAQPAVVPIPEPSVMLLVTLSVGSVLFLQNRRRAYERYETG